MNLKEYEAQLALGTVDFRQTANETQSSTVLQDIIGRTDDIAVLCAVATNPRTNIYTLTLLATFPRADEGVIVSCAYHPNVTLSVLERWMKYPTIERVQAVQRRVRALQLALGVSEKDALVVVETPSERFDKVEAFKELYNKGWHKTADDTTAYPTGIIPRTQKDYTIWTTTGHNSTLEIDDRRFRFTNDPADTALYYSYDSSNVSV